TSCRPIEGRPCARTFHGRDRGLPRRQTRDLRRRPAAYRMAIAGALADRAMGHLGIQPRCKARLAGISRGLLAENSRAAGRSCVEKERARVSAQPGGNGQAGEKPENRFVRRDSPWRRPDDSSRSADARRSQRLSPWSIGRSTSRAKRLARVVNTCESEAGQRNRKSPSVRRLAYLLFPRSKNYEGIL